MDAALEILLGIALFTGIVLCLVGVILAARRMLDASHPVALLVNGSRTIAARSGTKLLEVLAGDGVLLPAACGGKGSCGMCRVQVVAGAPAPLPTETAILTARELGEGQRLACQVRLEGDVEVRVPEELVGVRHLACRVRSNRNVATFIKELVLELPPVAEGEEPLELRAGHFVQITCPPYRARFADFDVEPRFREDWDRLGLWRLEAGAQVPTTRAYSLANRPDERDVIVLVVRIATPPPHLPDVPPGIVSSWIFGLEPGDPVDVTGPYGHFVASESEREMVLVGGGAGMAPLRAHVFDQLERLGTARKVTFWYGARSRRELFWVEELDRLAAEHANFSWTVALSEPRPDDGWDGPTGFIHHVLLDRHLRNHPDPAACEYYLCGPPMMIRATRAMLADLGVDPADVHFDDFGGAG
jgi:Na+-transporting NADH:ubiquinone oxidoreductase subunit F